MAEHHVFLLLTGMLGLLLLAMLPPHPALADPKAIDPLKVMSFNIRYGTAQDGDNAWPKRREHVLDMLRAQDCDLLGLQECLDFQLGEIAAGVPGLSAYALGREKDGGGEMCAILWRTERFELIDSGSFGLGPERKLGEKAWDAALPRMCSWVQLYDKLTQHSFWLYNTHFDHVGEQARQESAKLLLQVIAERNAANGVDMPVLITGDLNSGPDSAACLAFSASLQDCFWLGQSSFDAQGRRLLPDPALSGSFHDFKGGLSGPRIDYIFASSDFGVLDSAILHDSWLPDEGKQRLRRYPSDHFPVTASVYFQQ